MKQSAQTKPSPTERGKAQHSMPVKVKSTTLARPKDFRLTCRRPSNCA
jgi:hypothetical protein